MYMLQNSQNKLSAEYLVSLTNKKLVFLELLEIRRKMLQKLQESTIKQ